MKKDSILGLIFALGLIGFISYDSLKKSNDINEKGIITQGKIIDEYFVGGKHYIKYEFYVNNKKYTGEDKVAIFKCDDGSICCVGNKFNIRYAKNNPNNSDIDLGKYNKYKTRTKLYKFFEN